MALGRALVRRAAIFLFDEPLSNLDAKLRVQMRAELKGSSIACRRRRLRHARSGRGDDDVRTGVAIFMTRAWCSRSAPRSSSTTALTTPSWPVFSAIRNRNQQVENRKAGLKKICE